MSRSNLSYLVLLAPSLLLLGVFFYYPAAISAYYSLFEWDGQNSVFIGLENYMDLLRDPVLRDSFVNVAILVAGGLAVGVIAPVVAAEFVFNLKAARSRTFYQFALLVPGLVPGIVVLLVWQFLYDPYFGPINAILGGLGFDPMDFLWLAHPDTALLSIILIGFPWVAGPSVLIVLSGLNSIPESMLESCELEGLGKLRRFFAIDVFFLTGQIRLLAITGFIGLVQAFGVQLVLTGGGPGTSTMVPGYHLYLSAFSYDRLGYATAMGLVIAVVILVFTILNFAFTRRADGL